MVPGKFARVAVAVAGAGLLFIAPLSRPALATNDPYFTEQWALTRIGAPAAWTKATGAGVTIGVVDTGIDLSHEDLAGKVVASTNCVGANDNPAACNGSAQDDQGHGTHVSGIAAALTNNGKGIAGVAPLAQLVVAKALQSNGSGALSDVNAGIKWVVDHGARIVNLSVEADNTSITLLPGESLTEGVEYAWNHGAIAVVAAGNSTPSLFGGGASAATVDAVVVGATGMNDEVAFYSSSLSPYKWGLVAPGGDAAGPDGQPSCAGGLATQCIVSTGWFPGQSNQYADDEGTSMATPHVAGVLALLMGQGVGLSRDAAVQRLLATADRISCGAGCHGRLDAAAAVGAVPAPPPPVPSTQAPTTLAPQRLVVTVPPTAPRTTTATIVHSVAAGPRPSVVASTTAAPTTTTPDPSEAPLPPTSAEALPIRARGSASDDRSTRLAAEATAALLCLLTAAGSARLGRRRLGDS